MPYSLNKTCRGVTATVWSTVAARLWNLHRDERGTISILSVITLLMLTMLLGMILNVGEQIDDKIKMQNAADAASYSSGVVMARGLNTLAFTNHLLSETLALTAYFREGRDRFAESLVPDVLDRWRVVGQQLGMSEFKLIRDMQPAIDPKIEMEQELVRTFGNMSYAKARIVLPALEVILGVPETPLSGSASMNPQEFARSHLIPEFQRAIVRAIPDSSFTISNEIARRNSPGPNQESTQCVIWSMQTEDSIVVSEHNPLERILPAVDPSLEGTDFSYLSSGEAFVYLRMARLRREFLAIHYLAEWINDDRFDLAPFERETFTTGGRVSGKMSQFINLYRGFTRAKLNSLLQIEYPNSNLPHILRQPLNRSGDRSTYEEWPRPEGGFHSHSHFKFLEQQKYLNLDFTYLGSVYRTHRHPIMPGMYRVPVKGDAVSFAAVQVYLPRNRYTTSPACPRFHGSVINPFDGTSSCETPAYDNWPEEWSLFSQNWSARLIPASTQTGLEVVQQKPEPLATGVTMPDLKSLNLQDLKAISFH